MLKGLYVMSPNVFENVYSQESQKKISEYCEILAPVMSKGELLENTEILKDVDVIFSSWGAPLFDETLLDAAPNLKVVFYGAGTLKHVLTDAFWQRDIQVTTANVANAIPVAEYTLAGILFSLKNVWRFIEKVKRERTYELAVFEPVVGNYKATVGIISMSQVGRMVVEHLKRFDVNMIGYDPFVSDEEFDKLGVRQVSLDELFKEADVVSLHAPLLPDTEGMIHGEHFRLMKENATFINTARGAIVEEQAMIDVLQERLDLTALLDVTSPEPPEAVSLLYDLPNVVLTPHIAGSAGNEQARLGSFMVEELERFVKGEELKYSVSQEQFKRMA